ncbi:MAG: hypothetical protein F6K31_30440 [Symploca sp. SIO2G7]|nr:hypothetical protein [Symploca sp. SIO2G7]
MPFSVTITESSLATVVQDTTVIDLVYLFGTSDLDADPDINTPIPVEGLQSFNARFPNTPQETQTSVKFFFDNYPQGSLFFVSCHDADVITGGGTQQDAGHFTKAAEVIAKRNDLDLGIIVTAEMATKTTQADRTTVYSALQGLAEKLDWVQFVNLAAKTKADAITERNLYGSTYGHSAAYYGFINDSAGNPLGVNIGAAIVASKRSRLESPYSPPAGVDYPLSGVVAVDPYVDIESDYQDLRIERLLELSLQL